MQQNKTSCTRCVGGEKYCDHCGTIYIRHGYTVSGKLRYKCKNCNRR
ncbi:transposase-like zinc-binding domain-containing protein [Taibaiella helva]